MKGIRKLRLFTFVIMFSLVVCTLQAVLASNVVVHAGEKGESSLNDEVVLAYYDVKTGKETLYRASDFEKMRGVRVNNVVYPKSATNEIVEKKLSTSEIENLNKAQTKDNFEMETISTRTVDNRMLVSNPQADPYYKIAKLYFNQAYNSLGETGNYMGTGFAVGNRLCATARHCLTDNYGNWSTNFTAYYGYNGNNNTYNNKLTNVSGYIYYPQYITGKNADGTIITDPDYDIAFVIWDQRTVEMTGCFGMNSALNNNMALRTAGYPGDLNSGLRMYESYGNLTGSTDLRMFCNNIYCMGGQSGSTYFDADQFVYGVITHTAEGASSGRRLDSAVIQWIIDNKYD